MSRQRPTAGRSWMVLPSRLQAGTKPFRPGPPGVRRVPCSPEHSLHRVLHDELPGVRGRCIVCDRRERCTDTRPRHSNTGFMEVRYRLFWTAEDTVESSSWKSQFAQRWFARSQSGRTQNLNDTQKWLELIPGLIPPI